MPQKKRSVPETDDEWVAWGKRFGRRMEAWGERFGDRMEKKAEQREKRHGHMGGLLIGLFLLAWGVTLLGNDLKWWVVDFPFFPALVIVVAVAILISSIKKLL